MDVKSCENCEQMIDGLEESFVYQGHVVCKKCKNILDKQTICLQSSEEKSCNGFSEERKPNKKTSYILKHWRGELSLVVSFWVNIFLLNIVILLFWTLLNISGVVKNPVIIARVVIIVMTFTIFPVYPWQFIGLWRCCSRHIKIHDKYFWARIAQVVIILGFIATLSNLTSRWSIYKGSFHIAFCKDNILVYDLILIDSNIEIDKSIEIIYPESIFAIKQVFINTNIKEKKPFLFLKE